MEGTKIIEVTENIKLACMTPEAKDLLDVIMSEWEKHKIALAEAGFPDEPSNYAFAYWLTRYSGLIKPASGHGK